MRGIPQRWSVRLTAHFGGLRPPNPPDLGISPLRASCHRESGGAAHPFAESPLIDSEIASALACLRGLLRLWPRILAEGASRFVWRLPGPRWSFPERRVASRSVRKAIFRQNQNPRFVAVAKFRRKIGLRALREAPRRSGKLQRGPGSPNRPRQPPRTGHQAIVREPNDEWRGSTRSVGEPIHESQRIKRNSARRYAKAEAIFPPQSGDSAKGCAAPPLSRWHLARKGEMPRSGGLGGRSPPK
jgi:hypothetical protein